MTIRGFAFIKGAAGENSVALWGPIKLGQKVVCFMGPAHKARTKSGLLYGQAHKARTKSGLLYGQQIECPSQKIRHCQNSVALWMTIKLGQKVVCFMGDHKARTSECPFRETFMVISGNLYGHIS